MTIIDIVNKAYNCASDILCEEVKLLQSKYQSGERYLKKSQSLKVLSKLIEVLEVKVADRLNSHSILFWLNISRELPVPISIFIYPQPRIASTSAQIIQTLEFAIFKHASRIPMDVHIINNQCHALKEPNDFKTFFEAFYLSYHVFQASCCYRRAYKGAKVKLINDDYECYAKDDAEADITFFDDRKQEYGGILDGFGYFPEMYSLDIQRFFTSPPAEPVIFHSSYVESRLEKKLTLCPNLYMPSDMFRLFRFWQDIGIDIHGLPPLELLVGLSALSWSRWAFDQPDAEKRSKSAQLDLAMNGYSIVEEGVIIDDLLEYWPKIIAWYSGKLRGFEVIPYEEMVNRFFQACTVTERIDLNTWSGAPLMSAATKNDGNIMKNGQERRGRDSGAPSRSLSGS